jgi:hypothetical protein
MFTGCRTHIIQIYRSLRFHKELEVIVLKGWYGIERSNDVQYHRVSERPVAIGAVQKGGGEEVHSLYRQHFVSLDFC